MQKQLGLLGKLKSYTSVFSDGFTIPARLFQWLYNLLNIYSWEKEGELY